MPGQLSGRRAPTLPLAPLLRLLPGLPILLLLLLAILLLLLPIPILLQLLPVSRRRPLRLLLPPMRCLVLPLVLSALLVALQAASAAAPCAIKLSKEVKLSALHPTAQRGHR